MGIAGADDMDRKPEGEADRNLRINFGGDVNPSRFNASTM
jgi:hypothetical protein